MVILEESIQINLLSMMMMIMMMICIEANYLSETVVY